MPGGQIIVSSLQRDQNLEAVENAQRVLRPRTGYAALYSKGVAGPAYSQDPVFPIKQKPSDLAVRPDFKYAAYITSDACVCIDRDGREVWKSGRPVSAAKPTARSKKKASCCFSRDGTILWLYWPHPVLKGSSTGGDTLLAVDAEAGQTLCQSQLPSQGNRAQFFIQPNAQHCLLSVVGGQGQAWNYLFTLLKEFGDNRNEIWLTEFGWAKDRIPLDISPSGFTFMTVGSEYEDIAFHHYRNGSTLLTIPVPCNPLPGEEAFVMDSVGGYIDDNTLITSICRREKRGKNLFQLVLIDVQMSVPPCCVGEETENTPEVVCLGDGRWLSPDAKGNLVCRTQPEYFIICPEVAGGMGDETVLDTSVHPPIVSHLSYAFTDWLGDCLLTTFPCYIVTERLAEKVMEMGLTGVALDDVEITYSEEADDLMDEGAREAMPGWRWLKIIGEPSQSDFGLNMSNDLVVSRRVLTILWRLGLHNAEVKAVGEDNS